jgi:hypothetical protein
MSCQICQLNISVNLLEHLLILFIMMHPAYKINCGVIAKMGKSKAVPYEDKE